MNMIMGWTETSVSFRDFWWQMVVENLFEDVSEDRDTNNNNTFVHQSVGDPSTEALRRCDWVKFFKYLFAKCEQKLRLKEFPNARST